MNKMCHLASSEHHRRKAGNRTLPALCVAVSRFGLSKLLESLLLNPSRSYFVPSDICIGRSIDWNYDCESDSMSSQSSGVENRNRPKIAAYPMRSRYESSRSGLSTILESLVAIAIIAKSDGSLS